MSPGAPNPPARRSGSAPQERERTLPVAAPWRFIEAMCSHRSPLSRRTAPGGVTARTDRAAAAATGGTHHGEPRSTTRHSGLCRGSGGPLPTGRTSSIPWDGPADAAHRCRVRRHRRPPALPSHIPGKKAQTQDSEAPGRSRHCRAGQLPLPTEPLPQPQRQLQHQALPPALNWLRPRPHPGYVQSEALSPDWQEGSQTAQRVLLHPLD